MRIGIPSFRRVNRLHSMDTLERMGYGPEDIIISTQTGLDYAEYKKAFAGRAQIIYRAGTNDSMNRNACIDFFDEGERFLLIDDDIKAFCGLIQCDGKKALYDIRSKEELERIATKQFDYCDKHNSPMFAWYPTENAYFMSNTIDLRNIFVGTVLGVTNSRKRRFNEVYDLKGDFEISLRLIEAGYNAVRFNGYVAKADHRSKGGCEEARKAGHNAERYRALLERYPTLIKPSHREGEIRYTGSRR